MEMVEQKKFRMDLYYRLRVVYMKIPPIRERQEDIIPFIDVFMDKLNKKYDFNKVMSSGATKLLLDYSWPGNVREIENEIERLVVTTSSDLIREEDVLGGVIGHSLKANRELDKNFRDNVLDYERILLQDYISKSENIHDLSKRTGLENSTLRKKAKRLGIEMSF